MNLPDEYAPAILGLSFLLLAVWGVVAFRGANDFHRWHDDRAALALASRVGIFVAVLGLTISAIGFVIPNDAGGPWAAIGLGVARGALLVAGITLLASGHRR